jgi:ABC-type Zn uptake system ZnuABC Zn-binding protein ZnuA
MLYDKHSYILIDYPGEYDVQDMFIKAFVDKTGKLNYIVVDGQRSFAIVQSPRALDEDEISDADIIYYTDDAVEKMLDKLEMDAKREKLVIHE